VVAPPPAPKPEPKPEPKPVAAAPAPAPPPPPPAPEPKPAAAAKGGTPMEIATACLGQGDNKCVIEALDGKAKTAREYELLIETLRATVRGEIPRRAPRKQLSPHARAAGRGPGSRTVIWLAADWQISRDRVVEEGRRPEASPDRARA
jgi:hypothetical protein